jgi:hypothetical protein
MIVYSCKGDNFNNGYIQYSPLQLSNDDKELILSKIKSQDDSYDPIGKMLTNEIKSWNYHTDAISGTLHQVRSSFNYAVNLLDYGTKEYEQRAFDVLEKTISLQDTDPLSPSCGVWPYYEEEPLATKKSPIDYNWADFNAVSLLDVYMYHKDRLPKDLLKKVEDALILAAKAVQKRNCQPSYTNIAIMGTYVTYLTSNLFDLTEMQEYAKERLKTFYNYTIVKGGFTEYNSPTYSIVAIDELGRMKRNIVEPEAKKMIDKLYEMSWEVIARHYHKNSAQWAGPHSRSYSTLVSTNFYGILKGASNGKIDLGYEFNRTEDVKLKHKIPENLLTYFLSPQYPRLEVDIFEKEDPQVIGTTYLTEDYAISSVSRSSLWNQRRPILVYWGELNNSHYLQVRMLHDFYDFSTASIFSQQKNNQILSAINFATNGGDKHISIDRLKDGRFKATDLRLRFEIGNCDNVAINLPQNINDNILINADNGKIAIRLLTAEFDNLDGYWEKGSDGTINYLDYIIYNGKEKDFDLTQIEKAILSFALMFGTTEDNISIDKTPNAKIEENVIKCTWNELSVKTNVKPDKLARNL